MILRGENPITAPDDRFIIDAVSETDARRDVPVLIDPKISLLPWSGPQHRLRTEVPAQRPADCVDFVRQIDQVIANSKVHGKLVADFPIVVVVEAESPLAIGRNRHAFRRESSFWKTEDIVRSRSAGDVACEADAAERRVVGGSIVR